MNLRISNPEEVAPEPITPERVRVTFEVHVAAALQEALLNRLQKVAGDYGTRLQKTVIGSTMLVDLDAPRYYPVQNIIAAIHSEGHTIEHVEFRHGEEMEELKEAA